MTAGAGGAGDFAHVLWLGGGTGAGKTTVATRLAERFALATYHYDRVEPAQIARMTPERQPRFSAFAALDMDARWVAPTAETLMEMTLGTQDERFALVLEDLAALPHGAPVIAEGFGLRPDLVAPLLDDARRAVYLLPTPEFRARALGAAARLWTMPNETSNPERALANRLGRDRLLTEHTRDAAIARGMRVIDVDGTRDAAAITDAVAAHWAPWLRGE